MGEESSKGATNGWNKERQGPSEMPFPKMRRRKVAATHLEFRQAYFRLQIIKASRDNENGAAIDSGEEAMQEFSQRIRNDEGCHQGCAA